MVCSQNFTSSFHTKSSNKLNHNNNYCGISTDESERDSIMTENGSDSSDTTIIMYNSEDSESDQGQTSADRPDIDRSVTVSKQCMNYIIVCKWY